MVSSVANFHQFLKVGWLFFCVSLLINRQTNSSSSSGIVANCWCEVSYRPDALHVTQPTVSKYRRETHSLYLFSSLTAIFPGGPGLAIRECLNNILDLLELRMMEVVVTTGAVISARLQSPPTNQHPAFFYRPDALPVAQPTASQHWREVKGN